MSDETIHLGDQLDFVQLQALEIGTLQGLNEGDLRLAVFVQCDTFCGSYDQVWIAQDQWSQFVGSLARLERERTGKASVFSMSPEEFELTIEIVDRAGHAAASGLLSRYHFNHPSGEARRSKIEFHFGFDPGLLRQLSDQIKAFRYSLKKDT